MIGIHDVLIGCGGWALLLGLLFLGVPVGVALILVSFAGICVLQGFSQAVTLVSRAIFNTSITHLWSLIPLFVFMGYLANELRIGENLFQVASKWFGHVKGGLLVTTLVTSAGFGAVCGDNMAAGATMTSVCFPELRKYKYDESLSLAAISSGALLSFLIPPSLGFIIYGLLANVNIGALFLGGIFPGLICTGLYAITVYWLCSMKPTLGAPVERSSWKERIKSLSKAWVLFALVALIFGGMYSGIFTITEVGALSAFLVGMVGVLTRKIGFSSLLRAISATIDTVGMIFLLVAGAWCFAPFLSMTTLPQLLANVMAKWPVWAIILCILSFYFFGGMIFEAALLMIITIPLFMPVLQSANIDLLWLGVMIMVIVIASGITPPVGLVVYVVSGVASGMSSSVSSARVFRMCFVFLPSLCLCALLIYFFPWLATWLPNKIF